MKSPWRTLPFINGCSEKELRCPRILASGDLTKVADMLPLGMIEVREYLDHHGRSPYADSFDDLTAPAAAKVATAMTRLAQGNLSHVKGARSGVLECSIDFGPG